MDELLYQKIEAVNQRLRELATTIPRQAVQRTTLDNGFQLTGWKPQVVIDVINEVFGPANWRARPLDPAGRPVAVAVALAVAGEWTEEQVQFGDELLESAKAQFTDGLMKALSHFGVARDAYLGLLVIEDDGARAAVREWPGRPASSAPTITAPVGDAVPAPEVAHAAPTRNGTAARASQPPAARPSEEPLDAAGAVLALISHSRETARTMLGEWAGDSEERDILASLAVILASRTLVAHARRHRRTLPPLAAKPLNGIAMDLADDQSGLVVDFDQAASFEPLLQEVLHALA